MIMGKGVQVPSRLALYRALLDRGLLNVCEWALRRDEAQILHAAAEVLTLAVEHDVNAVRMNILKESDGKRQTLVDGMIRLMQSTKNLGLLGQMSDTTKALIETVDSDVS